MEDRVMPFGHPVHPMVVVLLFAASWLLRLGEPAYGSNILPVVLAVIAVAMTLVPAWLGGELVYRLGIGVDREGRHADPVASEVWRPVGDRAHRPA